MISKEDFIRIVFTGMTATAAEVAEIDQQFKPAEAAAHKLLQAMPGIGILSLPKRLNAFFSVCRHIDQLINDGEISVEEAQICIMILRLSNPSFKKAVQMFDLNSRKFSMIERCEMPRSARYYMAYLHAGR